MLDMEIVYPEGINTKQEEREFDSFLLIYISEQAVKQRSPKIRIELGHIDKAWHEHKARKSASH
jgi:hypothetical protein